MQIDFRCSAQITSENGSLIPQRCSDRLTRRFSMAVSPAHRASKLQTTAIAAYIPEAVTR